MQSRTPPLVLGTAWASWTRDTCERLIGFYFVLGTTWASWSRDTCESLSGFYLVLVTLWASPGGRKQFASMGLCFGKSPEWQDPPPVLWVFMFPIRVFRVGVSVNMFYYILPTFFRTDFVQAPWFEWPQIPAHQTLKAAKIALGTWILCQNPSYLLAPQPRANAPPSHGCVPPPAVSLSLSLFLSNRSATRKKVVVCMHFHMANCTCRF